MNDNGWPVLKGAVIGVGFIGQHHARVYRELRDVELLGVVDPNLGVANAVGARNSVPAYPSLEALLEFAKPDLASVAVPTHLHYQVGMALIERGISVLMEKPIATTAAEGEALVRAARDKGVVLAAGHIERFNPAIIELKKQLGVGIAGRIHKIFAQRLSPYPPRIHDVGVVVDLASHDIDLLRHLVGKPVVRICGETLRSISSHREDVFNGLMRFEGGAIGVLDVNWMTPRKVRRLSVTGDRGHFECDLLSQELFFYENDSAPSGWDAHSVLHGVTEGNVLGIRIQRHEPLAAEIQDFVAAVQTGQAPAVTGEEALETLRIALEFVRVGHPDDALPTAPRPSR